VSRRWIRSPGFRPMRDRHEVGRSRPVLFGGRYDITSVSKQDACGGETITILGTGFGRQGRVFFPSPDPDDPIYQKFLFGTPGLTEGVPAASWTDTRVDVVVPRWAVSGDVRLNVYHTVKSPCRTRDIYRLGNSILFLGGLATVIAISLNGQQVDLDSPKPLTFAPRETVQLSWTASIGPTVRVRVSICRKSDGQELWKAPSLFSGGAKLTPISVPDPGEPTHAQLILSVTGACGHTAPRVVDFTINIQPRLAVDFIEVTQGVQTDRATQSSGFVVPLVEGKDTGVRVYVSCNRRGWFRDRLGSITGALRVSGGARRPPPMASSSGPAAARKGREP
jgi:hypothetical protein